MEALGDRVGGGTLPSEEEASEREALKEEGAPCRMAKGGGLPREYAAAVGAVERAWVGEV